MFLLFHEFEEQQLLALKAWTPMITPSVLIF